MVTLGFIGCAHCHTPWIMGVLKARGDVCVKSVCDHMASRAATCAKELGCRVVPDQKAILDDPEIQAVFITSETNLHEHDVLAAVAAKKPLFVEKPLGMGGRDAAIMARAIEQARLPFCTGYRTRSEAIFIFLHDEIQKGHFGKITRIRYVNGHKGALTGGFGPDHRWMTDPAQAGGGAFLDLGTHALDTLLWLMGEPVVAATSVVGRATDNGGGCEEYGEGLLKFKSGAIGSLAAAWVDMSQPVRCEISGTEGHACVVNNKLYYKSNHVPGSDSAQEFTALPNGKPLVFDLFIDSFIKGIDSDFITPLEAAYVCTVQDALTMGSAEGRWVEPIDY